MRRCTKQNFYALSELIPAAYLKTLMAVLFSIAIAPFHWSVLVTLRGASYLMAFTDRNEFAKWNQGSYQQSIVYTFGDYKAVLTFSDTPYRGVVLNPFGDNIVLGKELFFRR